jgi:sugar phosphate isomerase/epimerase
MPDLKPLEPGVMMWTDRDSIPEIRALGVRCGQLGVPGEFAFSAGAVRDWRAALQRDDFTLVTVFAAYTGESYADAAAVRRTVGFIPRETRTARLQRTLELSDFAGALGVGSIACHIGFVPEDRGDLDYLAVRDMVRQVCDHAAFNNHQTFALETGQEPADVLLRFIRDVDRENLRINFDPANMIMYGTGDPIEALRTLALYVASVHAKDGVWPERDSVRGLGSERPLGQGEVGIERLVGTLKDIGFRGPLNVERETESQEQRLREIREGIELLRKLVGAAERT